MRANTRLKFYIRPYFKALALFAMPDTFLPDRGRRFGGFERLYGPSGLKCLFDAHVAVAGIGGVGSWCVEALARSGVGAITLIDLDHIAESNINRQLHALTDTLGQAKVQAMADRLAGRTISPRSRRLPTGPSSS